MPRVLPILAIAVGGVLAIRAVAGVGDLPQVLAGAKAWAEEAAPAPKTAKPGGKAAAKGGGKASSPPAEVAAKAGDPANSALPPGAAITPPTSIPGVAACAPTAAELARQAGLSPAELQVLQSLGTRRGQLDQREKDLDVQLALMAAAEAKLDAKLKTLNGLKSDIQGLIGQADAQKVAEMDRLVKVYEGMKPKDAGARMAILDDSVRLPIAAKMKERALSAVLGQMSAQEAKILTEKLADRMAASEAAKAALANKPVEPPATAAQAAKAPAAAAPKRQAKAKPRPLAAKPTAVAQASPSPVVPTKPTAPPPTAPAKPTAPSPTAPAAPVAAAPAKAG